MEHSCLHMSSRVKFFVRMVTWLKHCHSEPIRDGWSVRLKTGQNKSYLILRSVEKEDAEEKVWESSSESNTPTADIPSAWRIMRQQRMNRLADFIVSHSTATLTVHSRTSLVLQHTWPWHSQIQTTQEPRQWLCRKFLITAVCYTR